MKESTRTVQQDVLAFRIALGDTQQAFAHRLGIAISSAARYETNRPPTGLALKQFIELARKTQRTDFEQIFTRHVLEAFGIGGVR